MFIVAVTRWGPGLDEQLPALAQELGVFPYDLRMRLAGPLPVVVARVADSEAASKLMHALRARGHGAVGCDADKVPAAAAMHQPREFAFAGDQLTTEGDGQRASVGADEVYALIHAMVLGEHQITKEQTGKKFSASRAVLTGGMVMTTKTKTTTRITESTAEARVMVIRRSFAAPVLFRQHQLRYGGLGEAMGHSSHESFAALVDRLRGFCPGAIYDDQLLRSRCKDDGGEFDLAAYLILIGHARGQI